MQWNVGFPTTLLYVLYTALALPKHMQIEHEEEKEADTAKRYEKYTTTTRNLYSMNRNGNAIYRF